MVVEVSCKVCRGGGQGGGIKEGTAFIADKGRYSLISFLKLRVKVV